MGWRRSTALLVTGAVVAVVAAGLVWGSARDVPSPDTSAGEPRQPVEAPTMRSRPTEGLAGPPDARVGGRTVWFAPDAVDESELAVAAGPVPGSIEVDQPYPLMRPGDVSRASMVMGVVNDSAAVERLLVLESSGQVFEVDVEGAFDASRQPGVSRIVVSISLSSRGTRITLGQPNGEVVLDLLRLRVGRGSPYSSGAAHNSDPAPAGLEFRGWTGPAKANRSSTQVARAATTAGIPGLRTESDRPTAVVVDGERRALLVLDGDRGTACCEVAGWLGPSRVLVESRSADQLRLLAWDIESGRLFLVSTISPVVDNDSYLVASYADLDS